MSSFYINWFDLVVVALISTGLIRGRKRGMSEELLELFRWLLIVVLAAMLYQPLGSLFARHAGVGLLFAYVTTYIAVFVVIFLLFSYLKQVTGEKLVGSDVFGSLEYYLGTLAGGVRFFCMVIVVLALMNSVYISEVKRQAEIRRQQENFGSVSFPTFGSLQNSMVYESVTGQFVRKYLKDQLIEPTGSAAAPSQRGWHGAAIEGL